MPETRPPASRLTSGLSLARNTVLNLLGQGAPLLVAIIAIPFLIRGLGTDRFGVLTLAYLIIGYFSLFDLGLGRALTQMVALRLGAHEDHELPALVWTSLTLMLALGLVGAAVLSVLSSWVVVHVLRMPRSLQPETVQTFYLLAASIPVVITTAGLRGILEAHQRFGLASAVRLLMGAFSYLGPLMVLPFSHSLVAVVSVLMAGRLVGWLAHFLLCLRIMPALRHALSLEPRLVLPLLRFGGWLTVSNVVGPLMVYLDRFLIGALISVTAVAYYATPYEVVTKLWLIPTALVGVLFPAFASSFVQNRDRTALLFGRGVKYVFLAVFPVTLATVALAYEALLLWLGPDFARHSSHVLQWLAIGVFTNSLATVPFALLQSVGRPDLTAKLHLIELPFYLAALAWLLSTQGIEGAAIAWAGRVAVDALILFALAQRFVPVPSTLLRQTGVTMGLASVALAVAILPLHLAVKGPYLLLALAGFALLTWSRLLSPEERALGRHGFRLARLMS
jgi:O-antigen/teichoic acid export membrane protein